MGEFLRNAENILEAASRSAGGSEVAILIDWTGHVRITAGSDWPLESLQREYGARVVYRVSEKAWRVRVDGRSGSRRCLLESSVSAVARGLLRDLTLVRPEPDPRRLLP